MTATTARFQQEGRGEVATIFQIHQQFVERVLAFLGGES